MGVVNARYRESPRKRKVDPMNLIKRRSAQARQCPACGRKSALRRRVDTTGVHRWCRWVEFGKCTYPGSFTPLGAIGDFEAAV
jgi:ribosomal protein L37AE/L43A